MKRYRTRRNRAVLVRRWLGQALMLLVLLILLVLTMVPLAEMVRQSLQGRGTLWERAVANYTAGWLAIRGYMINSAIASLTTLVGVLFCSSLAGYTFARHRFPGKDWLYLAILALMMIPTFLTLIPAFMVVNDLGLVNSRWGLILPWIASGQVLGILGGTGSSKTTLVQLVPRLYETMRGRILVGRRDVREYRRQVLRRAVAMVLQKNVLFSGTIAETDGARANSARTGTAITATRLDRLVVIGSPPRSLSNRRSTR